MIDESGELIGRVTLRTATALVREHYEAQLMATAGMDESDDLFAPIMKAPSAALWARDQFTDGFPRFGDGGLFENVLSQVGRVSDR